MALVGKIFGKAKRQGAEAGPVSESGVASAVAEPDFELANAEQFWRWFARNASQAARLNIELQSGGDPDALVRPLFNAVQRFDGRLSVLVGMNEMGGCELVISAETDIACFPAVTKLVAAAPHIPGWRVTAFKPRIEGTMELAVNGRKIGPGQIGYVSRPGAAGRLDLDIALPFLGDLDSGVQTQLILLLINSLVGEYDAAMRIGSIVTGMTESGTTPPGKPLSNLPSELDGLGVSATRH
jgi:hypothetical protein